MLSFSQRGLRPLWNPRRFAFSFLRLPLEPPGRYLIIYAASVTDVYGKDYKLVVIYMTYKPVITDAVTPLTMFIARQRLSVRTRIFTIDKMLAYPCVNHLPCIAVKLR